MGIKLHTHRCEMRCPTSFCTILTQTQRHGLLTCLQAVKHMPGYHKPTARKQEKSWLKRVRQSERITPGGSMPAVNRMKAKTGFRQNIRAGGAKSLQILFQNI